MNLVRWLLPASLVLALSACDSGDGENTFDGPLGDGQLECEEWVGLSAKAPESACDECLHRECATAWQAMSSVCAGYPAQRCTADGGAPLGTQAFCACMVGQENGCGTALANVYACFVNECAATCAGSDAGTVKDAGGKG